MGIYINKGNNGFRISRNSEYVDKSGLIAVINATLNTKQMFSCVSRGRRFGKTRNYPQTVADYTGDILLVGINYDKDNKQHECLIEHWKKA